MTTGRARLLLAAAAVCAALAGYWMARQLDRASPQLASGTWLPRPKPLADFSLTDTSGRAFLPVIFSAFLPPQLASAAGPAIASVLIYVLMAGVLYFRPQGLFPARG